MICFIILNILKNMIVFEIIYRFKKGIVINKKEKSMHVKNIKKTIKGIFCNCVYDKESFL